MGELSRFALPGNTPKVGFPPNLNMPRPPCPADPETLVALAEYARGVKELHQVAVLRRCGLLDLRPESVLLTARHCIETVLRGVA